MQRVEKIEAKETDYLYIQQSQVPNSGKGLFTAIKIYKHERIAIFKGEILNDAEAEKRAKQKKNAYFMNMIDGTIMDCANIKCFAKYANDAKGLMKTRFKNNADITLDEDDNVCIAATKNINSGDEILCGYGKGYWKNYHR